MTASQTEPSLHSASLMSTNVRRSLPESRAASAEPVASESPWPSEPVEKSTPGRT